MKMIILMMLLVGFSTGDSKQQEAALPSSTKVKYFNVFKKSNYDAVYTILKEEIADFPDQPKKVIQYEQATATGKLTILLKKKKVKINYRSSTGNDAVVATINRIKGRLQEL